MRQVVLPYRTPGALCWRRGSWRRVVGDQEHELPDRIDDWDHLVPIHLVCEVEVDVTRLRAEAALTDADPLALVALWEATSTNIRAVGCHVPLPAGGERTFRLDVQPASSRIGGTLKLERQIVLTSTGSSPDPLAARAPGSVLLRDEIGEVTSVLLEGDAARFPTEVVDFSQFPISEPDALWSLEMSVADLEQPPLSALQLYVNGSHPAVRRALDSDDGTGELVRSVLQWDVARAMIHRALDNDAFVEGWSAFEDGTLGATLRQLVQRIWPGEDAASLRARRDADPARFEYLLQARLGLLSKVR